MNKVFKKELNVISSYFQVIELKHLLENCIKANYSSLKLFFMELSWNNYLKTALSKLVWILMRAISFACLVKMNALQSVIGKEKMHHKINHPSMLLHFLLEKEVRKKQSPMGSDQNVSNVELC